MNSHLRELEEWVHAAKDGVALGNVEPDRADVQGEHVVQVSARLLVPLVRLLGHRAVRLGGSRDRRPEERETLPSKVPLGM